MCSSSWEPTEDARGDASASERILLRFRDRRKPPLDSPASVSRRTRGLATPCRGPLLKTNINDPVVMTVKALRAAGMLREE